jgi:hypothetical protein
MMYFGQNEKRTMIRIEPRNPRSRVRDLRHYINKYDIDTITTLVELLPVC